MLNIYPHEIRIAAHTLERPIGDGVFMRTSRMAAFLGPDGIEDWDIHVGQIVIAKRKLDVNAIVN